MRSLLGQSPDAPSAPPSPAPVTSPRPGGAVGRFDLAGLLDGPASFDQVFRVVRGAVRSVLGLERPGLGLGLSNLPPSLGAYWQVTGNLIVLNEGLVQTMKANATSPRELNSFLYVVLAHEYLHALGYLDEHEVRRVTAYVTRAAFGEQHVATRMAEGDLWKMYPFLQYAPVGDGRRLTVVRGFDLATTQHYIR